ncbi:MAG TPA: hypothetical protein VII58_09890 [Acidobacteriaceae bacterium]
MTTNPPTHRVGAPPVSSKPVSIRITPEIRAVLDFHVKRTGLKDAQLFRLALMEWPRNSPVAAAAPKPARTKR